MHPIEPFNPQERIWQIVYQIPAGRVASYGQIAALAGLPRPCETSRQRAKKSAEANDAALASRL
jgi:alkylated DNA nucleotide flippase Atl1